MEDLDGSPQCTSCGTSPARYCARCRSATYCSPECQQVDWRTHRLLCRAFKALSAGAGAARPSPIHHLAIHFPMAPRTKKPRLVWIATAEIEPGYSNPVLDALLRVPRAAVRAGECVRGRGRSADTLNLWYVDDAGVANPHTNQALHEGPLAFVRHAWGEKIWEGPVVAATKAGDAFDARRVTDVSLTAYRDALDYLGYFRDGVGSMVDGVGVDAHSSRVVLAERMGKVKGVRINCLGDQAGDRERELVQVDVPKAHSLFNLEGDDPLECLGWNRAVGKYQGKWGSGTGEDVLGQNPLASLIHLQVWGGGEQWGRIIERRVKDACGSILVVDRTKQDLTVDVVRAVCRMVEQVLVPLIAQTSQDSVLERDRVVEAITLDRLQEFMGD
ncbi:hypothetical protein BU26DRAFT_588671 [Trematosphaeria pertusa]|uniref:MYND-type domain-containing protein n=1 Tax=Trematosphaeria pertusa TaxID=390896 RepID=A0A6A6ISV4_9PLEO|nr:uncharacterized protein BU26DRAFT_588671 [Trematosphaeria pertusa]KAF2253625.1 hypothetical protein BU26DRAFT_588671 [Trematosphaeria pertusa]